MFSREMRERMISNVVSVHGTVILSVTDFDSPAILLNDTPYLNKIRSILDLFDFFVDVDRALFQKVRITKWKCSVFLF